MNNEIIVSVYCLAYNHENYITQTLEGFINQKTNFKFEVFVHDDASTDNTKKIIMDYAERYPDVIKPILQKENQYSKGIDIKNVYIIPHMKGKYIAVCEGDDFWCNTHKLQKQVDFLETHPDYSACVHNTQKMLDGKLIKDFFNSSFKNKTLSVKDVILSGAHEFHLSSVMYRRNLLFSDKAVELFKEKISVGDYPLSILLSISGKIYYFNDIMSVYRVSSTNSWTQRIKKNNAQFIELKNECINILNKANVLSNYIFDKQIKVAILCQKYEQEKMQNQKINLFKYRTVIFRKIRRKVKLLIYSFFYTFKNRKTSTQITTNEKKDI